VTEMFPDEDAGASDGRVQLVHLTTIRVLSTIQCSFSHGDYTAHR
jgi:hypothetical protein